MMNRYLAYQADYITKSKMEYIYMFSNSVIFSD